MQTLFAPTALLPDGWAHDVRVVIDDGGTILSCTPGAEADDADCLAGTLLPGMPNLHSHAFQRAMAGLTEHTTGAADSFWTWREVMYGFVGKLDPEDLSAIAAQLYVEMLKAGYTAVAEFHYLHHDRDGTPYGDRALMSETVIASARATGIAITALPVLYQSGGFGGKPTGPGQRRFVNQTDDFLAMIETLRSRHQGDPDVRVGVAPHSLRAVTSENLAALVAGLDRIDATAPIHIHIAEQVREVEECIAWSDCWPVEWLLNHQTLGPRWCLVHATHMQPKETRRLAASGAIAGLCPTTEGNLGDGFFPWPDYLAAKGHWGIGSDSHISVSPIEELRWLEYGARLGVRRRNLATAGAPGATGTALWRAALGGGATALGRQCGALAPGLRADLVVLDDELPTLYGRADDRRLNAAIFAGNLNPVRDVMVGGRWVVREGHHNDEHRVAAAFRRTIDRLTA